MLLPGLTYLALIVASMVLLALFTAMAELTVCPAGGVPVKSACVAAHGWQWRHR